MKIGLEIGQGSEGYSPLSESFVQARLMKAHRTLTSLPLPMTLQKEPGCALYSSISSLGAKQLFTVRSARQSLVMSFRISEGGTYWSELGALQASWGNEHLVDR